MVVPTASAAVPAPSGESTDFNAPNELWQWNILCQSLCLGIPGILWMLRLYVRVWIKRVWIFEDYLTVLSYTKASLVIYGAILTTIINHGGGVHDWDLEKEVVVNVLYWANVVQIWYGPAAAFIKSTILLLYLRVFSPTRWTPFDTAIRIFILVVVLFSGSISIAKIFECSPREKIWDTSIQGTCVNLSALLDASGLFNIISDIVILLVPVKGLWGLRIDRKRKISIYAAFTVGVIGPAFSIVGLDVRFQHANGQDQTYNQPVITLWAMAELATGMMIICFPTLPSLLQHVKRQPSRSQPSRSLLEIAQSARYTNNSERYYELDQSRVTGIGQQSVEAGHIELPGVDRPFAGACGQTGQIVNNIQGGRPLQEPFWSALPKDPVSGRKILKTVTVEQMRS